MSSPTEMDAKDKEIHYLKAQKIRTLSPLPFSSVREAIAMFEKFRVSKTETQLVDERINVGKRNKITEENSRSKDEKLQEKTDEFADGITIAMGQRGGRIGLSKENKYIRGNITERGEYFYCHRRRLSKCPVKIWLDDDENLIGIENLPHKHRNR